jgi:redox-sensitive bicupin YhaK (pirin superfamily)
MTVSRVQDPACFQGRILKALEDHARMAIIGGTPLQEKRHMYWNFVSTNNSLSRR